MLVFEFFIFFSRLSCISLILVFLSILSAFRFHLVKQFIQIWLLFWLDLYWCFLNSTLLILWYFRLLWYCDFVLPKISWTDLLLFVLLNFFLVLSGCSHTTDKLINWFIINARFLHFRFLWLLSLNKAFLGYLWLESTFFYIFDPNSFLNLF